MVLLDILRYCQASFRIGLNSIESSWYMKMQLLDVVARYLLDVVT